jgi:hypothetical protein
MTDNEYCKHGSLICWNQCHECSDEEDEQGDKDKRIAELEAALAKCAWHSHIEELEEDAQKFHDDMEKYKADNARLRKCLEWLEWVDKYTPSGRLMPFCPACGSPKATGHQVDCLLAAEIGGK